MNMLSDAKERILFCGGSGRWGLARVLAVFAGGAMLLAPVSATFAQQPCTIVPNDPVCNDGIPCTTDTCVDAGVSGKFCKNNNNCENTLYCDGISVCCTDPIGCDTTPFGSCIPPTPVQCIPPQFCSEAVDSCVECLVESHCEDENPCTSDTCEDFFCNNDPIPLNGQPCEDGNFCTLSDICSGGFCTPGPLNTCNEVSDACHTGQCNQTTGNCGVITHPNGTVCDPSDVCVAYAECQGGTCTSMPSPGACIDLVFRMPLSRECSPGSGTYCYDVDEVINVDVWAEYDGCPAPPSEFCGGINQPVSGIELSLLWDPTVLELADPNDIGAPNPEDPCDDVDCTNSTCGSSVRYNWGTSAFPDDCTRVCLGGVNDGQFCFSDVPPIDDCPGGDCISLDDGQNAPCADPGSGEPPVFPQNDGNAYYLAFEQTICNGSPAAPACISLSDLWVTKLKFRAIAPSDGLLLPSLISINPCSGIHRTKVIGGATTGEDVLDDIGQPARIVVQCRDAADCGGLPCVDGACQTCQAPAVSAGGPRYLMITPVDGNDPVALKVTGIDPEVSCVTGYVQSTGTLGPDPAYRTPAQWAGMVGDPYDDPLDPVVPVRGASLAAGWNYQVQADCNSASPGTSMSEAVTAKTWKFADVDNNTDVNIIDVTRIFDGFRGVFHTLPCTQSLPDCAQVDPYFYCDPAENKCLWTTRENTDISGSGSCAPDRDISIIDAAYCLDAFRGIPDPCPANCP